ncbi:ATP-binding cassette domain-containing protein [Streptomyces sp. NPDC053755]|uniref:ATP-binding cassette domain-containing protein n=1 Tax=Streptomyces sp. NPDC053755 TaxID=3155815 RepID=UPI00341BCFE9
MAAHAEEPQGAAVVADGFGLKGPRGWAFREVGFRADPGALVAIEGPSGSGRTCLLLALTGRMKPHEGHAEVAGHRLPRHMGAVRRISALGPVPGVSDLDPAFTVDEHLRERALLQRRFDGSLRSLLRPPGERAADARTRIQEALKAAGLDPATLPKAGRTSVRDLERLEALRLSVALALIGRPRLLALDDTDLKLSDTDRAAGWSLLRSIADAGTTVLAVCSEAPEGALRVTTASRTTGTTGGDATDAAVPDAADESDAGTAQDTAEERTGEAPAQDTAQKPGTEETGTEDRGGDAPGDPDAAAAGKNAAKRKTAGKNAAEDTAEAGDGDADTIEEGAADALAETGRA